MFARVFPWLLGLLLFAAGYLLGRQTADPRAHTSNLIPPGPAAQEDGSGPRVGPTGAEPSGAPRLASAPVSTAAPAHPPQVEAVPARPMVVRSSADLKRTLPGVLDARWSREVLTDPTHADRYLALDVLTTANPEEALPYLRRLYEEGSAEERAWVVRTVTHHLRAPLVPLAHDILGDERTGAAERGSLLSGLAELKGKRWATAQLTGPPDTPIAGDHPTAWAHKEQEMGEVWVEVDFPVAVVPDDLRIHETLGPGGVIEVLAKDEAGRWITLWSGVAPQATAPHWFEPPLSGARFSARTYRLILDTDLIAGWQEIDAIELVGDGRRQWASAARASSSYAGE